MPLKIFLIFCFTLPFLTITRCQVKNTSDLNEVDQSYFFSIKYGYQMSGIKSEDFVSSNYSPLFNITVGKWFSPYLAFQIGYKGLYFNSIADNIKHHYNYFYGEAILNLSVVTSPERINHSWDLLLHAGAGYFYNYMYGRPNTCASIGLQNNYQIMNQLQASLDIATILGWDIYQGDFDILPGISIGVTYLF